MKKTLIVLGVIFTTFMMSHIASAHHSFSEFDRTKQHIVTGEVQRWVFNNPHVWLDITGDDGTTWNFEGAGVVQLLRNGINGSTFNAGDQVTVMFCPLRDGRNGGAIGFVKIGDGPMISPNDGGCFTTEEVRNQWEEWLEQGYTSNTEAMAAL